MDREYARPPGVLAMARVALMSSAHFSRRFRAAYGETPYGPDTITVGDNTTLQAR